MKSKFFGSKISWGMTTKIRNGKCHPRTGLHRVEKFSSMPPKYPDDIISQTRKPSYRKGKRATYPSGRTPSNIDVIYTSLKSTFSEQQCHR